MKTRLLILVATLALVSLPLFGEEGTFDRTLKVTGPVDLDVMTGSGHIDVRSGSDGQVVVHGIIRTGENFGLFSGMLDNMSPAERIKAIQNNPPMEQSGNVIRIGHVTDHTLRNVSISYEITVPRQTRLNSHTGSGSQTVTGIAGPLEANTGSGHIRVSAIGSGARLGTGSGNIEVSEIQGDVRAHTGSGSITAERIGAYTSVNTSANYQGKALPLVPSGAKTGTGAYLEFETGSGGIHLRGAAGALRAHTGSGHIDADGQQTGDWELRTGSGGVTVRLPAQAAFTVSARSSSGRVETDFPVTIQGSVSRRELRGTVNGGGPSLDIHTGSGSIRIEK